MLRSNQVATERLTILVTGACGQMGKEVIAGILQASDMVLVGAVDPAGRGKPVSEIVAGAPPELVCSGHLASALAESRPQVMIDFTHPDVVMDNIQAALNAGVACVVGTTGLSQLDLQVIERMCQKKQTPCLIAPNFSIGANLMMKFAAEAAGQFDYAEIIERHHEKKADAPSGTALTTAEKMARARTHPLRRVTTTHEELPGARGGETEGVHIHSVRLPGYVANQEVVFGNTGEILKIEHITTSRECFTPGVLLAARKVRELEGLVYGLDQIL